MNGEGKLTMTGELSVKHLPKGEGALPNAEPREYPNSYDRPGGSFRPPRRGLLQIIRSKWHSFWLNRKIKAGKAPHGRTSEPD